MKKILMILLVAFIGANSFAQSKSEAKIIHLNDDTFKEKVFDYEKGGDWKFEGDKPVIVDFYADWCGPCKRIAPVLKELQKEYGDAIQIYKVDTDDSPLVSRAFGIRSIPSLLFVPMKGKPTMAQGALPKAKFVEAINDVLGVKAPN
ncbi:thioredoxin [Marinifilum caeruleilacunae]|uniref:Thioredoxin n=1 Tax=Marinifilum caeruleilacunae TaxID=2499076 RepID=A0ABX1WZF0_9BACT|nr:thioredoxin [Marinifilum caeruleilacunae]NOU61341.1 thioredoxin [Marinifilum caeruleilacunae]